MQLSELAERLGAELVGDSEADIIGVAAPPLASAEHVVFAESEAMLPAALASAAGAVITIARVADGARSKPLLLTNTPKLTFARAGQLLRRRDQQPGVHPSAFVDSSALLEEGVSIGPHVVIERDVVIGRDTTIDAGAVIGAGAGIGSGCHIYPRVVLYPGTDLGDRVIVHAGAVLGADGFGYVRDPSTGEYTQFPQQGRLVVEDDVEIGANSTVDRGALEETRIASGTKLDNLVHVGHNVCIGRNVVIAAQTGVSGSSSIGDGAIVGGQVGIADHVQIGAGAILGAQAGIPSGKRIHGPGVVFWGTPARPIREYLKELATLARLTRRAR
jgi:UDP-3-O-[3-hydroxymyristoyl] glucosamine N-acyltransferase